MTAVADGTNTTSNFVSDTIWIRLGCELTYRTAVSTPAHMILRPRRSGTQRIQQEMLSFEPDLPSTEETDSHGNIVDRILLKPGVSTIRHDALVAVSSYPEHNLTTEMASRVELLPLSLLRYTQPSRYCDSDRLMEFAFKNFGQCVPGAPTVRAICDWVHNNIEYRFGSGATDLSASQVIQRGYGVCRDFAHATSVLCRTFNIPSRYVTGHLPDVGAFDSGAPMDFHAYTEVYLGNGWHAVDARFNVPRIGRVKIACGLDAVDGAFSTIYGPADLIGFYVWNYQVDPLTVSLGDPVDLSKRLDGTLFVRFQTSEQAQR
ncbi:MAG: transglutaminase family protein [Bryobacteraceae bacterium]